MAIILGYLTLQTWGFHPLTTEYWANMQMNQSVFSYIFLYIVACGTYASVIAIYYFNWIGFAQPMPFNQLYAGTLSYVIINMAVLFR